MIEKHLGIWDFYYRSCSPDKFYDLPEIKSKRSAGIGYANKIDLARKNFNGPAPNAYNLNSSFDAKKNEGITIGEGRDKIKANDMFRVNSGKVPSPLHYNPEKQTKSLSYTMMERREDRSDKWIRSVPGPGTYPAFDITSKEDLIPISTFISSPSTRFGKLQRLTEAELKNPKTPGPG